MTIEERVQQLEEWVSERNAQALSYPLDNGSQQTIRRFLGATTRFYLQRALDATVATSVSTTVGGDFVFPFAGSIVEIGAFVDTAGTTNSMTVDVNKNGTTLMATTKIAIETGEKTSRTAATQPVLSTAFFDKGDILTVDIDAIQTTAAKGLTVFMTLLES